MAFTWYPNTSSDVKTHLNRVFRKLEVGSRTDAVSAAIQLGLIPDPTE